MYHGNLCKGSTQWVDLDPNGAASNFHRRLQDSLTDAASHVYENLIMRLNDALKYCADSDRSDLTVYLK